MKTRITHFSDLSRADERQCGGKIYKRIGCLKLMMDDVSCIKCLKIELSHRNLKEYNRTKLEERIKMLTYRQDFDKLTK